MAYVDRIFASYKKKSPNLTANITKQMWLDGEHGWRDDLKQIGKLASEVNKIKDIREARGHWTDVTCNTRRFMRDYLLNVPLLENTAWKATTNDKLFRDFMSDLSTLTKL